MAGYTDKVDQLLAHATSLGFTEQDIADLAAAAADQSGTDLPGQRAIAVILEICPPWLVVPEDTRPEPYDIETCGAHVDRDRDLAPREV